MPAHQDDSYGRLLGQVYDCITQPQLWQSVLGTLCERLDLMQAVLGVYEPWSGSPLLRIQHGMAQVFFDRMPGYGPEMAEHWGGPQKIMSYPLGEVVIHSVARGASAVQENRFVREWCAPQSIVDFAAMSLVGNRSALGTLVFTSDRRLDPVVETGLDLLRLLSPHLRRALEISDLLQLKTIETDRLRAALEALPNGLILVEAGGGIVFMNEAAGAMCRHNDGIRISEGRLTLRDRIAMTALTSTLSGTLDTGAPTESGGSIPVRGSAGHYAMLHVLPLRFGSLRRGLDERAVAAIFMTADTGYAPLPHDALRMLFDLTPAEIRICALLLEGLTPAESAAQLGIATSTARTHLLRIFEKTGTDRQVELVRLIGSLAMPGATGR